MFQTKKIAASAAIVFVIVNVNSTFKNMRKLQDAETELKPRQRLADGCYHVFLDVGANLGVHGRFLLEPHKYPEATVAHEMFNEHFNIPEKRDNRDICVFEFEPNPGQLTKLKTKELAYEQMGWRYHVVPVGVSNEYGTIHFVHGTDPKHEEWGYHFATKEEIMSSPNTEKVPVIRLADWIHENIENRKLPTTIHGQYTQGPHVVMKLDIEGMEVKVLPDLIFSGALCNNVNLLFGEMHIHPYFYPMYLGNGLVIKDAKKARLLWNQELIASQIARKNCKTDIIEADDESYLHDGIILPIGSQ